MIAKNSAKIVFIVSFVLIILCSCARPTVPKPYGYVRITLPDTAYSVYSGSMPFRFALSQHAQVQVRNDANGGQWLDICYPSLNATIHGSYFPIHDDLDMLTNDAVKLVYKHVVQATAIPEQSFENSQAQVYGVLFNIQGNTASPYQFFVTDSVKHFFRASLYCECRPNADSLAPVYEYLEHDIRRLIESWQWVK